MNQDRFKGAVCVGSCALYRRAAVESFGGFAAINHSEDIYTGFKTTELGYKVRVRDVILGVCSYTTGNQVPTPSCIAA